jgi:hypothetical protein
VALVAAQPTLGWAAQVAARDSHGHCTNEICFCRAARRCPPRKTGAESCHETSAPRTMMTGTCHHSDETAPPVAVFGDRLGDSPAVAPAPLTAPLVAAPSGRRLAGHLEIHSPPPKTFLS